MVQSQLSYRLDDRGIYRKVSQVLSRVTIYLSSNQRIIGLADLAQFALHRVGFTLPACCHTGLCALTALFSPLPLRAVYVSVALAQPYGWRDLTRHAAMRCLDFPRALRPAVTLLFYAWGAGLEPAKGLRHSSCFKDRGLYHCRLPPNELGVLVQQT